MAAIPIVRGRGIVKHFDDVIDLDGIDLDVVPGQIHGLARPNGEEKTTLPGRLPGLAVAGKDKLKTLWTPAGRALTGPVRRFSLSMRKRRRR